jgi:3-hydroxybutyryl-CoA dehydrogenase
MQFHIGGEMAAGTSIGIIGPGRMGIGIATAVLAAGKSYSIRLFDAKQREKDRSFDALNGAERQIRANLALLHGEGFLSRPAGERMESLSLSRSIEEELGGCDIVFEAVPEQLRLKKELLQRIDPFVDERTILSSTTSTIDLKAFEDSVSRPQNVINTHWLNPAFIIPLVEVAVGDQTARPVIDRMTAFLSDLGKIPVVLRSSPGFIVPRIQAAAMNEAVRIIEEGVASAEEIDTAVKAGFGFRLAVLGLIEFIDLGGVDILYYADRFLQNALSRERFVPPESVVEKMEKGEVGPRAKRGYYDYEGIDIDKLFTDRYRGFLELLRCVERSERLSFKGGIGKED